MSKSMTDQIIEQETRRCRHFKGLKLHLRAKGKVPSHCDKDVPLEDVTTEGKSLLVLPCLNDPGAKCCSQQSFMTVEEARIIAEGVERSHQNTLKARAAIVARIGVYKKGKTPNQQGAIDCPVCGGTQTLRYSRAAYNGHIHAKCMTENCVSWME